MTEADMSIWERCARICDRSAELHRGCLDAEPNGPGKLGRMKRIEEAEWIAKTIRLAEKQNTA